jgi:hypothetical protein
MNNHKASTMINCRPEYIGVITVVIAELEFGNVQMQVFPANLVISSHDSALPDRPEAFNRVRVNRANNVLANGMINRLVWEAMLQSHIAGRSICAEQANAVGYDFTDESLKRLSICVIDHTGNDVALAFDRTNDRNLAGITAPALPAFLVPMPVFITSADIGFVNLDNSAKLLDVLDHGSSDLVAHKPSGLVGAEAHIAEDLKGAHALLADQHQMRDSVPIFQRLIRVLKDCAGQVRETVALVCAGIALPMESHCRYGIDAPGTTARALNALRPSASNQISNAIFLSLKQRVELRCGQLMDWLGMLSAGHDGPLFDRKETLA